MRSRRVIDLRKQKPGGHLYLPFPPSAQKVSGSERKSPLRARRRRGRALIALGGIVMLGALAYGVSWLSYLPRFSIQTIAVSGAEESSPALVEKFAEAQLFDGSHPFFSRQNIFLYPRSAIGNAIVAYFPRIKTVAVSRLSFLSTTLTLTLEERRAYARWCMPAAPQDAGRPAGNRPCYLMDKGGFIFAEASSSAEQVAEPFLFTGALAATSSPVAQTYLPGHLAGIEAFLERLGQAGFPPQSVATTGDEDFSARLAGFDVRASFGEDVDGLIKNLQLVLSSGPLSGKESQLEYVDLRFGDKVYYKLKGESQATTTSQ